MSIGRTRLVLVCGLALLTVGCAVPQPHGLGQRSYIKEPTTKRNYHLYLPKDYVNASPQVRAQRSWPVVVSFHGMKPFDNSRAQREEWEQEADRYGFVVVAPELRAPDVLAEFPLRTRSKPLISDEKATLAILNHVFATTDADPSHVLSTGWSSGGYMAHYMLNRHPERFTTLGVRQANFSHYVLEPELTKRSLGHPIFIVNTQNDFKICREESRQAVKWYQSRGYDQLAWIVIKDKGHERTPDLAAYFFAKVSGASPNTPATVLARRQALEGNREGIDLLRGQGDTPGISPAAETRVASRQRTAPPPSPRTQPPRQIAAPRQAAPPRARPEPAPRRVVTQPPRSRPTPVAQQAPDRRPVTQPPGRGVMTARQPAPPPRQPTATPPRTMRAPATASTFRNTPLSIRVSSAIGIEPLHLGFSAECPASWEDSADFLWMLNGRSIGSGASGQVTLSRPGAYRLELVAVTSSGLEQRSQRTIRVLPRLENDEVAGRLGE